MEANIINSLIIQLLVYTRINGPFIAYLIERETSLFTPKRLPCKQQSEAHFISCS